MQKRSHTHTRTCTPVPVCPQVLAQLGLTPLETQTTHQASASALAALRAVPTTEGHEAGSAQVGRGVLARARAVCVLCGMRARACVRATQRGLGCVPSQAGTTHHKAEVD